MIQLPEEELPGAAKIWLERWQAEIDALGEYPERVRQAKSRFKARNTGKNKTFGHVKNTLGRMCCGARRCMYCEDSAADEVEHIWPKDLYPEAVFRWDNYLYACGPCNGPKNNRFAVFSDGGEIVDVTRGSDDPVVEPPRGAPLLIDPRREDPLEFLILDLSETFWFVAFPEPESPEYLRAEYTIDVLKLNERDLLPAARREAYGSYVARLKEYIAERDSGASPEALAIFVQALQNMQHPTVWREMRRQHAIHPVLKRLFDRAPEALEWEF